MTGLHDRFVIQRIYNNNVVLALDARGRSLVLTGSGIGFGAQRGTGVERSRVEALYIPETDSATHAAHTLAEFPPAVIKASQRIIAEAERALGLGNTEALLLPLAEHLFHAVRRAHEGHTVDMPLVWEVKNLYPSELHMGERTVEITAEEIGINLQKEEATAFALHFLGASFATRKVDSSMRMTRSLDAIFTALEQWLGHEVDRSSDASTRFVTHLRYLFVRLANGKPTADMPDAVRESLAQSIPRHVAFAGEIADLLEGDWKTSVTEGEQAYIALHLHRLTQDVEGSP